ncbi:MAG: hypothetical protein WCO57_06635 [Verrucomicrobiota bacterium]
MKLSKWIRSRAATQQPLNLHAVARERPDLLELAFAGPTPRGWRRSLMDAGVDPYKIVHEHEQDVECAVCGTSHAVLGTHLKTCHDMTGEEYREEYGSDLEISSESYRAAHFGGRPVAGIAHWEGVWSRHYVIDWILRLRHEEGHDPNYQHVVKTGRSLANAGLSLFGSWDATLRAAGLDPDLLRVNPPGRQWTRTMVIKGLREFAKMKKGNWRLEMSNHLRMAAPRFFGTLEAAYLAAGLTHEQISSRAIFKSEAVDNLVAEIRALESLKGRERRRKLDAINLKNEDNHRIVMGRFGSLRLLAEKAGIDPRLVAQDTYRDEADVQHDLDILEREGKPLNFSTLKKGHKRLYNVISQTGWGAERLTKLRAILTNFPPCNPRSGLLRDRMIMLRRKLRISMATAAGKAGICVDTWTAIERGHTNIKATTVSKIKKLLAKHRIPVSAAP